MTKTDPGYPFEVAGWMPLKISNPNFLICCNIVATYNSLIKANSEGFQDGSDYIDDVYCML
jgi:hypothetical protein